MLNLFERLRSRGNSRALGYEVLESDGKRKSAPPARGREDRYVQGEKHRRLQGSAADLSRNMSLASWMVRRHLDYVSQFSFKSRTGNKSLDDTFERLMAEDATRSRFDVAEKFCREKFFRLMEIRRVLDGDTLLLKLSSGKVQGIQADLIKNPPDRKDSEDWVNGIQVNGTGKALRFSVYSRTGNTGDTFARLIASRNVIHYGFFERFAQDQVRGISPFVSALAPLRDVYENFGYALKKAKLSQLFALAFYQDGEDGILAADDDLSSGVEDADEDHVGESRGFQAFVKSDTRYVDLNPGEKVEVIESKQPSTEFQNFTELVIQVSLKSLDIPYSFYDESHTNFFGSRAAWLHYERSAKDKRDDQIEARTNYTYWKLRQWIIEGRLELPRGMGIQDLAFEWIPRGMPWWDPSKEITGSVQSIQNGLDTPQRICKATDTDFYTNVDQIKEAMEYAAAAGVPLAFAAGSGLAPAAAADPPEAEEPEEPEEPLGDEEEPRGDEDQDEDQDENETDSGA